jgi:hypothetical protein
MPSFLAERARCNCAHSMRAAEGSLGHSLDQRRRGSKGLPAPYEVTDRYSLAGWLMYVPVRQAAVEPLQRSGETSAWSTGR